MSFYEGFKDELTKLALSMPKVDPQTAAWAFSRGVTNGVAAALMAATVLHMGKSIKKSEREGKDKSVLTAALPSAAMGTVTGLGKGVAESLLERKALNYLKAR